MWGNFVKMAAIPQYMRNGERIGFIADEMGLDNETEPVAYHSCGFNTGNQLVHG